MKWLNILTDSEEFSEIAYELYSTQEDKDRYSQYVPQISVLYKEKAALFNSNLDKLLKYVKKSKKRAEEVYFAAPGGDDTIVFTAVDSKASGYVDALNSTWIYMNRLGSFLEAPYVFTGLDVEKMPELQSMEWPGERFVYSIPFPEGTTWEKLGIPELLRHSFIAAMAASQLMEQII